MNDHFSNTEELNRQLLRAARNGNIAQARDALERGADVEAVDADTGLKSLHIAIAMNDLPLVRRLLEDWNASICPDGFGRWPTVIAAQCRASDDVGDYALKKEAEHSVRTRPDREGPGLR